MKKFLLIIAILCTGAMAQANSFSTAWNGYGITGKYNYDMGQSFGTTYYRGVAYGVGVGSDVFVQNYNLIYDKDEGKPFGATVRHSSTYSFASPMTIIHLTKKGSSQIYVNAGLGYLVSGYDSVRKWNSLSYRKEGIYDSLVDRSSNLNQSVYRLGFGVTTYFTIANYLKLSITEDIGFLTSGLSKTTEASSVGFTNSAAKFFKPTYFSIRIGITYRTPTEDEKSMKNLKKIM